MTTAAYVVATAVCTAVVVASMLVLLWLHLVQLLLTSTFGDNMV